MLLVRENTILARVCDLLARLNTLLAHQYILLARLINLLTQKCTVLAQVCDLLARLNTLLAHRNILLRMLLHNSLYIASSYATLFSSNTSNYIPAVNKQLTKNSHLKSIIAFQTAVYD
ncbi:hypothetical protein [Sporosarcina sp. USHLN248]|uniref:hypothetical protein n=1 Tax=Sporosarcina sp. USHLN248 TaxID=3081300 RepID=UPI00301B20F8